MNRETHIGKIQKYLDNKTSIEESYFILKELKEYYWDLIQEENTDENEIDLEEETINIVNKPKITINKDTEEKEEAETEFEIP